MEKNSSQEESKMNAQRGTNTDDRNVHDTEFAAEAGAVNMADDSALDTEFASETTNAHTETENVLNNKAASEANTKARAKEQNEQE